MLSPKMVIGMVSGMLTDAMVRDAFASLTQFIQEKNTAAGTGKRYRMVIEPTADNADVILSIYLHDTATAQDAPQLVLPLSSVTAEQLKHLLKQLTDKK